MDGLQPAWLETLIFHFSLFTFFRDVGLPKLLTFGKT